jgi:hypothetical protein
MKDLEKMIEKMKKDSDDKFKQLQKRNRRKQGLKDRYKGKKSKFED